MKNYQAAIIGFGKTGKTLAADLARAGWSVALIEQSTKMYGGTCINIGCIPTKTLVHDAQKSQDFTLAAERKVSVVEFLRQKNYQNLADLKNLDVIDGHAEFVDQHILKIITDQHETLITADKIFINTGAEPVFPDIKGLSRTSGIYDSSGILKLSMLPKRLGILGAGYIGIEFASMFAGFGSKVTLFEASDKFLAREDADISSAVKEILEGDGIDIVLNAEVRSVSADNGTVQLHSGQGIHQGAVPPLSI